MILKQINFLLYLRNKNTRQTKTYILLFFLSGLLLLLNIIAEKIPIYEKEFNSHQTGQKILIVTHRTYFKKRVLSYLISSLSDKSYYIKIIDIKYFAKQDYNRFNVIIFLINCELYRNNQHLKNFLKTQDIAKTKKIILVLTASSKTLKTGWRPPSINQATIDTITCASKKNKTKEIARRILQKLSLPPKY